MKKLSSITLFFWACTCTQQAQHSPSESSIDSMTIWPDQLLAARQKNDHLMPNLSHLIEIKAIKK